MTARHPLAPAEGTVLVTDSGLETDLIFHHGVDLPAFAAFVLLRDDAGTALLEQYFREHLETAGRHGLGCVLETPTWRGPARGGPKRSAGRWTTSLRPTVMPSSSSSG